MNTSVNASGTGDGPSSCFNADIRRVLCLDDFEEFRARASSGGSLYGILRRQALLRGTTASGKGPVPPGPGNRPMQRQRSKSLIQRSVALPEDKCILKMLCDYSEMTRKHMLNRENRRHSEATLVYNRKKSSPIRVPAAVRSISPYPGQASSSANSHPQEPTRSSSPQPPQLQPSAAGPSTGASLLNPSDMAQLTLQCPRLSFCRRRSFSVTHNGVVNDGDDLVALPTALDPTDLDETTAGGGGGGGGSGLQVLGLPTLRSRQGSLYPVQVSDGKVVGESSNDDTGEELLLQGSFSCGDANTVAIHRVLMLGGPGVGKTALTQQFVTSEYMAAQNTSFGENHSILIMVSAIQTYHIIDQGDSSMLLTQLTT